MHPSLPTFAWLLTGLTLLACGRSSLEPGFGDEEGSGGDSSVGGSGFAGEVGSGGVFVTGGSSTGGVFPSGGTQTGGTSTGGADMGGTSTGGTDTGRTDTGGTSTGGADTGGTSTGGSETGGTSTGGSETGGTSSGGTGGAPPVCGNGVIEAGEACDLGANDKNTYALSLRVDGVETPIRPLDRNQTGVQFYARTSGSSHTGYEELGASRLILERDTRTGVVSLVIHSGIDKKTSGLSQPLSIVKMMLSGVPTTALVVLADDAGELSTVSLGTLAANWRFRNSSDGGVISGLGVPGDWTITIVPTFDAGITSFALVTADGIIPLALNASLQLVGRSVPSMCRTDCTVPACGDGVFDAGELCDDGNTVNGDVCGADCASF